MELVDKCRLGDSKNLAGAEIQTLNFLTNLKTSHCDLPFGVAVPRSYQPVGIVTRKLV